MIKKLFLTLTAILVLCGNVYAAEYFVDAELGSDSNAGTSSAPFATIGKAVENLNPGDIVTVKPGIYYESVNITSKGTKENPIAIRAEKSAEGQTIITGANREMREGQKEWTLYDEENNIWVTDYAMTQEPGQLKEPGKVLLDDVDLIPNASLAQLTERYYVNRYNGKFHPGYPQGFYYDGSNDKLYVRLRTDGKYGSEDPNDHCIKVAPGTYYEVKIGDTRYQASNADGIGLGSFNICVGEYDAPLTTDGSAAEDYYVVIDGFTLETPGHAGVYLRASNVTVRNCYFRGCRTGVRGAARVAADDKIYSRDIIIEHCDWSEFPVYDDAVDLICEKNSSNLPIFETEFTASDGTTYEMELPYYWWHRKGRIWSYNYEGNSIATYVGEHWKIRYNYIHDCFEGLSHSAMMRYKDDLRTDENSDAWYDVPSRYVEIYGNVFHKNLDNAIEVENRGRDISIYENYFYNVPYPISWQPEQGIVWPTNILVYKNVFHNTRDFNDFWSKQAGDGTAIFKIYAADRNWDMNWPWMEQYGDLTRIYLEDEGIQIFNNTIVNPGGSLMSNAGTTLPYVNFRMVNNVAVCNPLKPETQANGVTTAKLLYTQNGVEVHSNYFAPDSRTFYYMADDKWLQNGKYVNSSKDLGFKQLTRLTLNPELTEDSPLIGAGILDRHYPEMSRDIGALSYGETFDVSNVGVQIR